MNYQYNQTQMSPSQVQVPQNQNYTMQRPMSYSTGGWNPRVKPVTSIEEVRASSIDFDGSVFYFPDIANKKIYTKFINMDGTVTLNVYELKEMPTGIIADSPYVTREEFENAITQIRTMYEQSYKPQKEEVNNQFNVSEAHSIQQNNISPLQF